jgi:peptidoglycan/LPS O-acetylase OafA/YrhL
MGLLGAGEQAQWITALMTVMAGGASHIRSAVKARVGFAARRTRIWQSPPYRLADGYIRGLDGLRALAAIAVICFHLGTPGLALGWAGVNFFFVLSGFLITRILLDAKGNRNFYSNFYRRRALRIFPIYYLTLISVLLIGGFRLGRDVSDWPWYALYLQGWRPVFADRMPFFQHTWSLAIEEQFYLLWPFVVASLSRRTLTGACVILICLAPISRLFGILVGDWVGVWVVGLRTLDALAWGALIATLPHARATLLRIGMVGLAATVLFAIQGGYVTWQSSRETISGCVILPSLLAIAFAGVLLLTMHSARLASLFELAPLSYLGRISYGLYLYHYPIFFVVNMAISRLAPNLPIVGGAILKIAVTLIVSAVSFAFFERHMIALGRRELSPGGGQIGRCATWLAWGPARTLDQTAQRGIAMDFMLTQHKLQRRICCPGSR